uniref:TIL domain-containing protein n=1 Tax=Gongylonema pulchrum TaxID=637853 RepID=A0A183ERR6_9BILA
LIVANGQKASLVVTNDTGLARVQLNCTDLARWKAPNSLINIQNVSCLLRGTCVVEWAEWGQWSACTDTCGAFGSRQRFRGCRRNREDCLCPGDAIEKEFCNLDPCLYPRTACREQYVVSAMNQRFACIPDRRIIRTT